MAIQLHSFITDPELDLEAYVVVDSRGRPRLHVKIYHSVRMFKIFVPEMAEELS